MKVRFLLAAAMVLLPVPSLLADVIVLKSGRRIQAYKVEERGDRVYYETEDGETTIPKRLVERIERGDFVGAPAASGSSAPAVELPEVKLPEGDDPDVQRVVEGGKVDRQLLERFDREAEGGSDTARHRAIAARILVARLQAKQNDLPGATDTLNRALTFSPRDPALLLQLAALAYLQQQYAAALDTLRPVLDDPAYAFDAYALQGRIYYQREEMDRALAAWKHALTLQASPELEALIERVEREAQAVERFQDRSSGRFILRYEGGQEGSQRLAASILDTLESQYDRLASDFDVLPREPIVVLLYPNEIFYALTGMPPQVHGLFDGKIRVPLQGVISLTPRLEEVLRHELTHAFIYVKTRNRSPRWLHEGLAQWYAGQRLSISPTDLLPLFENRDGRGLVAIELAFEGDPDQIMVAYFGSLLVVDTLEGRFSRSDMERCLAALAQGQSLPQAMNTAFRLTLEDVDRLLYDAIH
ncbi:MAG: tetratricopeptide repeat protein [Candidatus Acidiferrales bacterium]